MGVAHSYRFRYDTRSTCVRVEQTVKPGTTDTREADAPALSGDVTVLGRVGSSTLACRPQSVAADTWQNTTLENVDHGASTSRILQGSRLQNYAALIHDHRRLRRGCWGTA